MANKRKFKKSIQDLGSSISFQLIYLASIHKDIPQDVTDKSVSEILDAIVLAKKNANHFFGSCKERKFGKDEKRKKSIEKRNYFRNLFKGIKNDYSVAINNALKQFNEALPASVKEENKAHA